MNWLPDSLMLQIQYFLQTGKRLRIKNAKTFGEHIQAYKLYYRNPLMHQCVDKVEVRNYVQRKGLEEILVPIIGIYQKPEEIDFEKLPDNFIIKSSDGGGNNEVKICRGKNEKEIEDLKPIIKEWIRAPRPKKHIAREWAYENNIQRRILIEQLLEQPGKKDIDDYKFFCYNGKFQVLELHRNRSTNHQAGHFDRDLNYLDHVKIYPIPLGDKTLPGNIGEMIKIAEKLAEGFPFVRVDLYNVEGKIYFGEMTFYPASGYFVYQPEEVNDWLGSFFEYPFK